MSKIKKGIKVERIVDFIDPDVEFVSLVAHAASRAPFTLLKSEGDTSMDKVIVSVLVPNTVTKEQVTPILKEYNDADKTVYDTYTKYQQVEESALKEDSYELIYLNKEFKVIKYNYHFTSHPSIFRISLVKKLKGCIFCDYKPKNINVEDLGFDKSHKNYNLAKERAIFDFGKSEKEYMRLYLLHYKFTAQLIPECFQWIDSSKQRGNSWKN